MSDKTWSAPLRRVGLAAAAGLLAAGVTGMLPASAAQVIDYGDWTVAGHSGTVSVPVPGFPQGEFTSTSARLQAPSGASTFLDASTPPGREFGSSKGKSYLLFGTAPQRRPSTTTIDFRSPTPDQGWGFVLGDVDAERVHVSAVGADGKHLTAAQLGWKDAFNFCQATPRPSSCTHPSTFGDVPRWDPATSDLIGNVADTDGASGWFMPSVPVKSLTLVSTVQSGIPAAQLWIAAKGQEQPPPPPPPAKTDVRMDVHAPSDVADGEKVPVEVTLANEGDKPAAVAVDDDLAGVLDHARYDHDATATTGTTGYRTPLIGWRGTLRPGEKATIAFTITIDHSVPNGTVIKNVLFGKVPGLHCGHRGRHSCVTTIRIVKPVVMPCNTPVSATPHGLAVVQTAARQARGAAPAC